MKVSELTSFDKVKDIVADMGLEYNNDNIIILTKTEVINVVQKGRDMKQWNFPKLYFWALLASFF